MGKVTDTITYNVKERGRKHQGQDRNFDTVALARLINGPAVQEQVKHGDMLGYFGHWPRIKFGMPVIEGGIIDGKSVTLPIAIRTIELSAANDGTISHKTEFLDTEAGIAAQSIYDSKAGGFSSAIVPIPGTSPMIAQTFSGFDFVLAPNFSTNRGHKVILDALGGDMTAVLDAIMAQAAQAEGEMAMLFDSLHSQHLAALEALTRASKDNDWLINRLAAKTGLDRAGVLDAILEDVGGAARLSGTGKLPQWEAFKDAKLEMLDRLPEGAAPASAESNYARNRFGISI
jgi:hypothetical protein